MFFHSYKCNTTLFYLICVHFFLTKIRKIYTKKIQFHCQYKWFVGLNIKYRNAYIIAHLIFARLAICSLFDENQIGTNVVLWSNVVNWPMSCCTIAYQNVTTGKQNGVDLKYKLSQKSKLKNNECDSFILYNLIKLIIQSVSLFIHFSHFLHENLEILLLAKL